MRNLSHSVRETLLGLAVLLSANAALGEPGERKGVVHFKPGPEEAEVPEMYRLEPAAFEFQQRAVRTSATGYRIWDLTFPSPLVTPFEVNNTVHGEYFCPVRLGKLPAVIVLHILGGDFELSRLFARQLAHSGVAALFIKLPYYGPRRPDGIKVRMVSEDPRETVTGMRQAVLDIRRAAAWLATQDEIDADQLGVFGISLGGITGALALAIEPKLKSGCLMLAGGDVAKVAWEGERMAKIRDRWQEQGGTKEEFFALWKSIDPVTYAKRARGKRMLMLNATHDEIIPPVCTRSLWLALGQPEIIWYEAGHITAGRFLLEAMFRVSKFFNAEK